MTDTENNQLSSTMRELATVTQQRDTLAEHIRAIAKAWSCCNGCTHNAIKAAVKAAEEMTGDATDHSPIP